MSDLPEPTLEEIQKQALDALTSIKRLRTRFPNGK